MKLVLGVLDVAYSDANNNGARTTTGDVATILEDRYHVFETFYELKKEQIAQVLADDMAGKLQDLLNGRAASMTSTLTYGADQKIEAMFRQFLDANEMAIIAGRFGFVLSAAANRGVSNRKMKPGAKRAPRPAFVDTGLYRASMRVWTARD